jgi:curved DNA-binding protein CbpA
LFEGYKPDTPNLKELTLYQILGIEHRASEEDIQKAIREASRKCHPDLVRKTAEGLVADAIPYRGLVVVAVEKLLRPPFEEKIRLVNLARDILSDEKQRQAYDASISGGVQSFGFPEMRPGQRWTWSQETGWTLKAGGGKGKDKAREGAQCGGGARAQHGDARPAAGGKVSLCWHHENGGCFPPQGKPCAFRHDGPAGQRRASRPAKWGNQ